MSSVCALASERDSQTWRTVIRKRAPSFNSFTRIVELLLSRSQIAVAASSFEYPR